MKRLSLIIVFLFALLAVNVSAASTYYVNVQVGSDNNPGTQSSPWKTIQKCLNQVQPGDVCNIGSGIYSESLTIKRSGLSTAPITLKGNDVTVNSGGSKSLITSGNINYYTIDGIDFISSATGTSNTDTSISFAYGYWGNGHTAELGNDGFILRNCYIEGSVYFYGSDNLVENCELNGKDKWQTGIIERSQPSENNIFRNNIIHDYTGRGGWTLQFVENSLWENNIIHDTGTMGIDCDGAGHPVYSCNIKNNTIYNVSGEGAGVLMENAFNSLIEGNTIHDVVSGISLINYGPDIADGEYRDTPINSIYRNNVIYNASNGLLSKAIIGGKFLNNTINNTSQSPGYWGAIALADYGGHYSSGWVIEGNKVSNSSKYDVWIDAPGNTLNMKIDNNQYDKFTARRINHATGSYQSLSFVSWQALGYDPHSSVGVPTVTRTPTFTPTFTNTPRPPTATATKVPTFTSTPTETPRIVCKLELYFYQDDGAIIKSVIDCSP